MAGAQRSLRVLEAAKAAEASEAAEAVAVRSSWRGSEAEDADEPPLSKPEDVDAWKCWAEAQAEPHRRQTHPRKLDAKTGRPTSTPLPLLRTSRRDLGRQFGAGVELYLDLLGLCLRACMVGMAVYAYSLYLNFERLNVPEEASGEGEEGTSKVFSTAVRDAIISRDFLGAFPLLVTLTSSGAGRLL